MFFFKKSLIFFTVFIVIGLIFSPLTLAEEDEIYEKCKNEVRAPWCYQETVEQLNEPVLCENILKYWSKANGVHGWCYYRLALIHIRIVPYATL